MKLSSMLMCDFYKVSHREQYPAKTEYVYSIWTPRASRIPGVNKVVAFGFQAFIKKYLLQNFKVNFFDRPKQDVLDEYSRFIKFTLGVQEPYTQHIADLHDLGYLPLEIKALPEGTKVPLRVPMLTIRNTDKKFFWLTNYIETLMSCELWMPCTSATIAFEYRKMLDKYAEATSDMADFVQFQGHDFQARGASSLESSALSGAGHLLSFTGTDTIAGIAFLEEFYNANIEKELVGTSIPATEHSVMCAYGRNEFETYKRLITEVYPEGFVSIVSDTWDLWKVVTDVVAELKDIILKRHGKVVIRLDSGSPEDILCGDENGKTELECKGLVEALWDIFGGTVNAKGFKQLDPHIGCIYGDSITPERCKTICERLYKKGFASTNVVYGIGSFTYQYNTRDTFGFALKSTHVVIDGMEHQIYKDPITDKDGIKKSQRGMVAVIKDTSTNNLICIDHLSVSEKINGDLLRTIFINGQLIIDDKLSQIRQRLNT